MLALSWWLVRSSPLPSAQLYSFQLRTPIHSRKLLPCIEVIAAYSRPKAVTRLAICSRRRRSAPINPHPLAQRTSPPCNSSQSLRRSRFHRTLSVYLSWTCFTVVLQFAFGVVSPSGFYRRVNPGSTRWYPLELFDAAELTGHPSIAN